MVGGPVHVLGLALGPDWPCLGKCRVLQRDGARDPERLVGRRLGAEGASRLLAGSLQASRSVGESGTRVSKVLLPS